MARIRTIKPEMASDATLAKVSRDARYTFVMLITQADDYGLNPGKPRQLLGSLYPHDEDVTEAMLLGWIGELEASGMVRFRQTVDGVPVLELTKWNKHQKVDHPHKPVLLDSLVPNASENPRENLARTSRSDLRTLDRRTMDLGPTPARKPEPSSVSANGAEDVSQPACSLTASQVAELTNAYAVDQGHIQTWARLGYRFDEITNACVQVQSYRAKNGGNSPGNVHRYGLRVMQENRANPQRPAPEAKPTEPKTFTFTPEQVKQQMERMNEHLRQFAGTDFVASEQEAQTK